MNALIFDFDGVIVDSETLHFEVFRDVLSREGMPLTRAEYDATYVGIDDRGCFRLALERAGRGLHEAHVEDLVARKVARFSARQEEVPPIPGAEAFVRRSAECYPLGIASGAPRMHIEAALARLGLAPCFRTIVSPEDYERGKPDPECFILCLSRLNEGRQPPILPVECLVVEDSRHGIAAALAAGMRCLALATTHAAHELSDAHRVAPNLEGIDPLAIGW